MLGHAVQWYRLAQTAVAVHDSDAVLLVDRGDLTVLDPLPARGTPNGHLVAHGKACGAGDYAMFFPHSLHVILNERPGDHLRQQSSLILESDLHAPLLALGRLNHRARHPALLRVAPDLHPVVTLEGLAHWQHRGQDRLLHRRQLHGQLGASRHVHLQRPVRGPLALQTEVAREAGQLSQDLLRWSRRLGRHGQREGTTSDSGVQEDQADLPVDHELVDEGAADVPSVLKDRQRSWRLVADVPEVCLQGDHWLVETALVLGPHVHVHGDPLHLPAGGGQLHQALKAAGGHDDAAAELGPQRCEPQHGVPAVAHADHQEAAAADSILLQKVTAELVQVPRPIAPRAVALEKQRRCLWPEGDCNGPILRNKALAEAVHVQLVAAGHADQEWGWLLGVNGLEAQDLVLHLATRGQCE
mmetsp:Transcript_62617/g.186619  ORF Transcript_62617/g.186619 Transcript_62617/m.186619 type:complete len:414 (-) Transcript_62617:2-1243(-)